MQAAESRGLIADLWTLSWSSRMRSVDLCRIFVNVVDEYRDSNIASLDNVDSSSSILFRSSFD